MSKDSFAVVLAYSSSYAIKIEKMLKKEGIVCKLIPVPRELRSDCGVCVRIFQEDRQHVIGLLNQNKIEFDGIYNS